jgi:hypothetical protein
MNAWLLRQLNVTDEFASHFDDVTLAFQYPYLLGVGLFLLVPAAIFVYLIQRYTLPNAPPSLRWTLTLTRVLILVLLVLVLGSPYLKLDAKSEKKPVVAVLFDHSQSMQLPAGPFASDEELIRLASAAGYRALGSATDADTRRALNSMSRAKLAHSVAQASGLSFLQELTKKYDVEYYSFARESNKLGVDPANLKLPEPPTPGGPSTQIGDAITKVLDEAAGRQVAGILVFSDGQNNGGRSPSEAARAAAAANAPVFTIPVGSTERLKDIAIVDLFATGLVSVGDTARVAVTLESTGFDKRTVKVELREGKTLLDARDLVLNSNEQQQIELTFKAEQPGARYLTVTVPPQPEEAEYLRANNTDTAFVRVTEEKLKVLLVDGGPRWDFRFLKNALRRDNGIGGRVGKEVDLLLETEWRRLSPADRPKALPRDLDQLAEYHTIILGDASPELLDASFLKVLDKAVRERGVGLIVAAGPQSMPHRYGATLQRLLPVQLQPKVPGRYPRGVASFRMELAPEGTIHEATRFYDDPGRNQNAWANLPRYFWCAAADRPSPAASVLVWNPIPTAYGKVPLVAHHYAGQGRVLFVGTDETFRWRQNVGDRFFYRFWGQSVRFTARRDARSGKKSWLEVRPVRAQPGEQAQIELMGYHPDGSPVTDARQSVQVQGGGGMTAVELVPDPAVKGRYTGKFTPSLPGEYRVGYLPPGQKEQIEARLRVATAPEELRQPNVDRAALSLLATTSGGQMVELPDLASIAGKLEGKPRYTELHRETTLWDNWLTLAVLLFLYCLDVGLRRLRGLS